MLSKGLIQAYEMQDFAFAAAMRLKEQLSNHDNPKQLTNVSKEDAQSIATLVKAWETAQERIRIHKGKPLPGSLVHEKIKRVSAKKQSVLSSLATYAQSDTQVAGDTGDASENATT